MSSRWTFAKKARGMFVKKTPAASPRHEARQEGEVLEAKPRDLTQEQFAKLCKSVARKIPKTLAILAK